MLEGPRIYNLFPSLVGPIDRWRAELPRISRMGFDWIFLNPFHEAGFSGSLYAVKDYYRLNPIFAAGEAPADDQLRGFIEAATGHGLQVMMDLVINHTSKDAGLVATHPGWFHREPGGEVRSPRAVDPDDPTKFTVWGDLAEIDYALRPEREEIVSYFTNLAVHFAELGFKGFRCDAAYKVPAEVWARLMDRVREVDPEATFFAETLGCKTEEIFALAPAGFDFIFKSSKWWDFRAPWLLEQYDRFRAFAPSIAFPESHDTPRLADDLAGQGIVDRKAIEAAYRQRYLFAALFSTGVMMPMGYEYGWRRKLDVVMTRPGDQETARFDLTSFIAEVNGLKRKLLPLNLEGPQRRLMGTGDALALLRRVDGLRDWTLTLINPLPDRAVDLPSSPDIADLVRRGFEVTPDGASGIRVFSSSPLTEAQKPRPVETAAPSPPPSSGAGVIQNDGVVVIRNDGVVVIQNVWPEIDAGRYPVKRVAGDRLEVWADIFTDGHGKIAAVLKNRRLGEKTWAETPMAVINPGLDRWRGEISLPEIGRWQYAIEAWPDSFASWHAEVEKKRAAGQAVSVELTEGRVLVAEAAGRTRGKNRKAVEALLKEFDTAKDDETRAALLLSSETDRLMRLYPDRSQAVAYRHELEVVVDRQQATYAAWYEMFARSQGSDPNRSATFADCTTRLPEIAAMGFDVVYLPPIHPIGRINRKGPNNTVTSQPGDPGSPYAIGSDEGGHCAIHPDLGTLKDFRAFVAAAAKHKMEIALDLAIQCAPDHPWIREHPEWFIFRPDGTIKYAENPPKKYQDIVNLNFHGAHREALWSALRDVVMFWVKQGVKIFRVDNPHTKPFPFWEWMIRDVQAKHPEVIFLAEAFTRPRVMELLAKAGFTQSYTYFTWRNTKQELTDYLTELTQGPVREYFRPNFFANTPDILPPILQTGGRAAFQMRLVLAATLSGVYGIYNGFELCEGRAIPNTEEYLHSEKYEYKVWDWDRPGNIKNYVAAINRIRRDNSAFHGMGGLAFHPADNDAVLFYSRTSADRRNRVFVAVNLDPHGARDCSLDLPLGDLGLGDDAVLEAEDLVAGNVMACQGRRLSLRLDPARDPALLFRLHPAGGRA
jgi:starch synthase (maltosyl-transferring)